MEGFAAGLTEIGRAVGWYFGLAFLAIVIAWVQFMVRWRDEKRELGISRAHLSRLLEELEHPEGALHCALGERFHGADSANFPDQKRFAEWFEEVRGDSRLVATLFEKYLWGVLSTLRPRLRAVDNRVSLTGVRNELKHYRYHRWLNFGLANTAVSLGILGTVTGLWAGFNQIDFGDGQMAAVMQQVMGALSQALYTTAIGVLISMPIVITGLKMEQQLEELFGQVVEIHNALVATLRQLELDQPGDV